LQGDVKDAFERLKGTAFVEAAGIDPLFQAATLDALGEHARNTAQISDVIATDDVRVQTQIHPGFALTDEILFLALRLEEIELGTLDGQRRIPSSVEYFVDGPHAAFAEYAFDLVLVDDHVARLPDLGVLRVTGIV
jgi:hypothetical protein